MQAQRRDDRGRRRTSDPTSRARRGRTRRRARVAERSQTRSVGLARIDSEPSSAVSDASGNTGQQRLRRGSAFAGSELEDLQAARRSRTATGGDERLDHLPRAAAPATCAMARYVAESSSLHARHGACRRHEAPPLHRASRPRAPGGWPADKGGAPRRGSAPTASRPCPSDRTGTAACMHDWPAVQLGRDEMHGRRRSRERRARAPDAARRAPGSAGSSDGWMFRMRCGNASSSGWPTSRMKPARQTSVTLARAKRLGQRRDRRRARSGIVARVEAAAPRFPRRARAASPAASARFETTTAMVASSSPAATASMIDCRLLPRPEIEDADRLERHVTRMHATDRSPATTKPRRNAFGSPAMRQHIDDALRVARGADDDQPDAHVERRGTSRRDEMAPCCWSSTEQSAESTTTADRSRRRSPRAASAADSR